MPALATVDIADAKDVIRAFKEGSQRWIVAVRMVSEGVDIPRLAVGVYATRARTPLLFRQVVGRFVRMRTDTDPNALLFIPAVDEFVSLAREIEEELRHQLERETDQPREGGEQGSLFIREPLSASEATLDRAIFKGDEVEPAELASAQQECLRFAIPVWSGPSHGLGGPPNPPIWRGDDARIVHDRSRPDQPFGVRNPDHVTAGVITTARADRAGRR
jgi:hypothetical protein